jgi:hypothetical protein
LGIGIQGPTAAALDAVGVQATLKLLSGDGTVAGQANVPVIFRDQATSRWIAPVTETPLSQQAQPGVTIMSFAVANLSEGAQAVIVKVFDASGTLVGSATTPIIHGAPQGPFTQDVDGPGGVYAAPLSAFLGIELVPSSGDTVFHGTVTFEGAAVGTIAPLVVQINWPSISSIPAKPE